MYLITWITTHLPSPERWMAELAKARSMQQDYIAARCEKLAQGFYTAATWPGIEPRICDTLVRRSTSKPPSHRWSITYTALLYMCRSWLLFNKSRQWLEVLYRLCRTHARFCTSWTCCTYITYSLQSSIAAISAQFVSFIMCHTIFTTAFWKITDWLNEWILKTLIWQ